MTEKTFGDGIKVCTEADLDEEFEAVEIKDKGKCTPERAREILGGDFYGREEISAAFGFEISDEEVPAVPYSEQDLEKAKRLEEMLVLRVSRDAEGKAMTMKRMNEIMASRMTGMEGKLLYSQTAQGDATLAGDCWYKDEVFFANEPLKTEWKLVKKEFVENSTNKNYIEQTKVLRDYLKSIDALTQTEEMECSDVRLAELAELMKTDWRQVAKRLVEFGVNKNHRRTPAEVLYDWVVGFKNNNERGVLEGNHDWSNSRSSDGRLVHVGNVDPSGASVGGWNPGPHRPGLGVCSSR